MAKKRIKINVVIGTNKRRGRRIITGINESKPLPPPSESKPDVKPNNP